MRRNRGYKRDEHFRDARLFVIACEGAKREKDYFEHLGKHSQRLKVKVVEAKEKNSKNLSAPKWIVDRLVKYIESEGVNVKRGDIVWIVMDVDRWPREHLYEINQTCREENWKIALSNPCFEVWLFMHIQNVDRLQLVTCQEFKYELGQTLKGGYKVEQFTPLAIEAIERCNRIQDDLNSPIPEIKVSRVSILVKEILEMF